MSSNTRAKVSRSLVYALSAPMFGRSLRVSLVVGFVLTAINQGDIFLRGEPVGWVKVVLTFLVPFCVSTYGAYSAHRLAQAASRGDRTGA